MFVDEAKIFVASGKGGDGMVSFRREKYIPRGGPSGGNGGRGGDVILRVNDNLNTLFFFRKQVHFKAKPGGRGGSSNKTGADAEALVVLVPRGTLVRDEETGALIADLILEDAEVVVADGGRGGKGNAHFKSSANQTPRIAEKGQPGIERWLRLELKLIADVALVGAPNAGKSTLLSVVSNAKPKVADYPFTTLEPNLGAVVFDNIDLVFADIPGLIEGAHMGVGLGHAFLRHVQRTRMIVHLVDGSSADPIADYNQIRSELALFDDQLAQRPEVVVVNKLDLPDVREYWPLLEEAFADRGVNDVLAISALARENVHDLVKRVFGEMDNVPDLPASESAPTPTYELRDDVIDFGVEVEDGIYYISGTEIERAAAMTYWDYDEAVARFQKTLDALGITRALEEAGVNAGDTVYIGDYELEWSE